MKTPLDPFEMTVILLARHGESDWNTESRWQGHADRPLTAKGRKQAAALAERLAAFDLSAVYSSDLSRARTTAGIVARQKGLAVTSMRELREIDVGSWAGLTYAEIAERYPLEFEIWRGGRRGWVGGESYEELADRAVQAIATISERHDGEDVVLVVSHGDVIAAIAARASGFDLQTHFRDKAADELVGRSNVAAANCALVRLLVSGGRIAAYERLD